MEDKNKNSPATDLSNFDVVKSSTAKMELRSPVTDAPIVGTDGQSVFIELCSMDSKEFRTATRMVLNRRIAKSKGRRGGDPTMPASAEEAESDSIDTLIACTKGWSSNMPVDGSVFPFSSENVRVLYTRFPWVREQVDQFIGDRSNFLKA